MYAPWPGPGGHPGLVDAFGHCLVVTAAWRVEVLVDDLGVVTGEVADVGRVVAGLE
jgi:hypothetical protein